VLSTSIITPLMLHGDSLKGISADEIADNLEPFTKLPPRTQTPYGN
jgi:hypothetical protein